MAQNTRPMPFTEEQMKQVFETNLIDFAVQNGFVIDINSKRNDRNAVHVKGYGGLFLFRHGRGYTCRSTDSKGNILDFAKEYLGLDFKAAVETILGCKAYDYTQHVVTPMEKVPKEPLVLPPKDKNFNRVIAYLTETRGINKDIVYQMIKEDKVYQSRVEKNGKIYTNCAFVGFDEQKEAKYCALRSHAKGYNFRQDVTGSDKTYGFTMEGTSRRVYAFEAPIDAMSHATLCELNGIAWREDHRVSEGCLSDKALERYLQLHPELLEIVFCYDNDMEGRLADGTPHNHGQEMAVKMAQKYAKLGYDVMIQTPNTNDFNSDLMMFRSLLLAQEHDSMQEEMER
ncbi:MAG: DUF3991 and TOPRIM domain-containing protein [Lachnospiraceae bacterium]